MSSKQKKPQKRKRQAGVSGVIVSNKKDIVFDEDARKEWLTNFSKRKLQRRQYGLAMQAMKVRTISQSSLQHLLHQVNNGCRIDNIN